MKATPLVLAFILGIILSATTVGVVAYTTIDSHNREFEAATTDLLLEHAISTCEYGSEMFYVARGVDNATNLATEDCADYLTTNGPEWFIDFYGLQE